MPGKTILTLFLLLFGLQAKADELIRISALRSETTTITTIKRDPFQKKASPRLLPAEIPTMVTITPEESEPTLPSIQYCGFLLRQGRKTALLLVAGDHVAVEEGETIMTDIRISSISDRAVTIEVISDGSKHELSLREN